MHPWWGVNPVESTPELLTHPDSTGEWQEGRDRDRKRWAQEHWARLWHSNKAALRNHAGEA